MPEQVLTPLSSAAPALAVEINVLSGAAVEPGLIAAADVFRQRTGNNVKITFATTPDIRSLLALAQHLMSWSRRMRPSTSLQNPEQSTATRGCRLAGSASGW